MPFCGDLFGDKMAQIDELLELLNTLIVSTIEVVVEIKNSLANI